MTVASLIVNDELHAHDPISYCRKVPEDSRWLISTEETGTLFIAPRRSEFVLPAPPKDNSPLHYDIASCGHIENFKLLVPVPIAPSSLVFLDGKMVCIADGCLELNDVMREFTLKITTCLRHESDGTNTYMYRVVGSGKSQKRCSEDDVIACECSNAKTKEY